MYLVWNNVNAIIKAVIAPVSEPGVAGKLSVEKFLSPAVQLEVLLVKKEI